MRTSTGNGNTLEAADRKGVGLPPDFCRGAGDLARAEALEGPQGSGEMAGQASARVRYCLEEDCPAELHRAFVSGLLAGAEETFSLFELLKEDGVPLPAPWRLRSFEVAPALWQVIEGLAERGVFLERTDHLSERRLYEKLWSDLLHREGLGTPPARGSRLGAQHVVLDVVGGCSSEDLRISLTYYVGESERKEYACAFPYDRLPARQTPPYDRDRFLPRPRYDSAS